MNTLLTVEATALIRRALEASQHEFVTLVPRLTQPFQRNAKSCADLCGQALRELMAAAPTDPQLYAPGEKDVR